MLKSILSLCLMLIPYWGNTQIDKNEENIFEEYKEPKKEINFEDPIKLNGISYKLLKTNSSRTRFIIKSDQELAVINSNYDFIIEPMLADFIGFNKNGFNVKVANKTGLFDLDGNKILPIEMSGIYNLSESLVKYIDSTGVVSLLDLEKGLLTSSSWCDIKILNLKSGVILLSKDCDNYALSSIDSIELNTSFEFKRPLYGGENWLLQLKEKYGSIDPDGKTVIPFEYDKLISYKSYFLAYKDSKCGIIDESNKLVIELEYDFIKPVYQNQDFIIKKNNKAGIINLNKDIIIPLEYDAVIPTANKNQFEVKLNGKKGLIDYDNKVIVPINYRTIDDTRINGYIVSTNNKYGLISYKGDTIIPIEYYQINPIRKTRNEFKEEGYLVVNEELKCSFFNTDGKQMTDFLFSDFTYQGFRSPVEVKLEGKTFFLNALGECVKDCPPQSFLDQFGLRQK